MWLFRNFAIDFVHLTPLFGLVNSHSVKRNALQYLTTVEQSIIHTPLHQINSHSSFDLTFTHYNQGQNIKFELSPNHDVIAEGAVFQFLGSDGSISRTEPIDRTQHKIFLGSAYIQSETNKTWENIGWARINVLEDGLFPIFEGAFEVDGIPHHIQTWQNYARAKHVRDAIPSSFDGNSMVLWSDADILSGETSTVSQRSNNDLSCGSDSLNFNNPHLHTSELLTRQSGRNLISTIGSTAGCPTSKQVALIGIATDCTYTSSFDSTPSARSNIITQVSLASAQYETSFNITLGIQNITLSDAACPSTAAASTPWNIGCSANLNIGDRLSLFSAWRGANPDNNAFWTLLSTCNTGSAVGLAWLGQGCNPTAETNSDLAEVVSSTNIVVRTSAEWQVIAHEVGHTFGSVHDCTATTCPDGTSAAQQCCPLCSSTCDAGGQYIMNPSSGRNNNVFSPCTIGNICSAIGRSRVSTSCLTANRNVNSTITGSQCGNGIVEVGEDCDCGGVDGCVGNRCCDPTTCKFLDGAQCDVGNDDCCTASCRFAGSETVCRASRGECDPQETCTGSSAVCPENVFATNGTSCGNSTSLYCASGQCTSRDLQCSSLEDTSISLTSTSNYTGACASSSCRLSCTSSQSSSCWTMQSNLIDGTTCGTSSISSRRCVSGVCRSTTTDSNPTNPNIENGTGNVSAWVDRHRGLVIGLAVGVGVMIILLVAGCCIRSKRRKRRERSLREMRSVWPRAESAVGMGGSIDRRNMSMGTGGGQRFIYR